MNRASLAALWLTITAVIAPSDVWADDFQTRCQSPGVIRCIGFDQPSDIAGVWGSNTGILPGLATALPVLDTTVKASGNSSLKFTIASQSGSGASGSYFANFSPDLSVQFGAGQDFYVQWRQRFSPEFLSTTYAGSEGWKQAIIGTGDHTGCSPANTTNCNSSCSDIEVVTQNTFQRGHAQMYHSCGLKDGNYEALEYFDSRIGDIVNQNNVGCTYSNPKNPPCVGYFANEWMTFQVHVKVGTWYHNDHVYHHDSVVQLLIARDGQPSTLVIDFTPSHACTTCGGPAGPTNTGYDLVNLQGGTGSTGCTTTNQCYGKVWMLPYQTNKDATQITSTAYVWYDELIISTQRIPDPASTATTRPSAPPNLTLQ